MRWVALVGLPVRTGAGGLFIEAVGEGEKMAVFGGGGCCAAAAGDGGGRVRLAVPLR